VTAPIGAHVRERFEAMRNAMIELLFGGIRVRVGLADTFRDHLGIAFLMACILAIFALHTSGIFEEVAAERASHDVVELLNHKLMAVQLVDLFFALANSTLAVEPNIERSPVFVMFGETHCQLDLSNRF